MSIAQNVMLAQFDPESLLRTVEQDEALAKELCLLFMQQCQADLAVIRDKVERRESDALSRALHRLKGASLAVCANRLAATSDRFEDIVREGAWQSVPDTWITLQEAAEEAVKAMRAYVGADMVNTI